MPSALSKQSRSWGKKVSGPPRYTTFPAISRPWARPAMVCPATASNMLRATSSLRAPWFSRGCMSDLANTPQREAMA